MAWVVPRTWVDSELVQAGLLNSNVRDNMGATQREVQVIEIASEVSNGNNYGSGNGTAFASFTSRDYPGYEVKVELSLHEVWSVAGISAHIGVVVDQIGHTATHFLGRVGAHTLGQVDWIGRSGQFSATFTPAPGTHTIHAVVWGGYVQAPSQAILYERGGPD